jgi:uncharacterized protein YprB with RNaseH-like and TPR domain
MKNDSLAGWLKGRAGQADRPNPDAEGLLETSTRILEEAFSLDGLPNLSGGLLHLEQRTRVDLTLPPVEVICTQLDRTLRLVFGIGPHHDEALRREGFQTLSQLRSHPRWGRESTRILETWGDPPRAEVVFESLRAWLPASHALALVSLGLLPRDGLLFFDLETLGLSNAPVFLIAVARLEGNILVVRQFLATSLAEERALLERFAEELETASALVSYNGKSFDWGFLRERFAYYGLPLREVPIHVDLLHHVRRRFATRLEDAHLGTVESHLLGLHREKDLPSHLVPRFYAMYLETGSVVPLIPVLQHNQQDIVTLALLLQHLLHGEIPDAR